MFSGDLGLQDVVDGMQPAGSVFSPTFTSTYANQTYTSLGLDHHTQDVLIDLWGATAGAEDAEKVQFRINSVPEPSSALLLGLGVLGFVSRRKRTS